VAARILGNTQLKKDEDLTRYLNRIGKGIAANAGRPELDFHFAVLNSDSVNAFAAPGGYVFVTSGALRLMADEAELAAVLGHEIGHVAAKHIVKELKIRGEDREGKSVTALIGGTTDPIRLALQTMVDQAVSILFERGYQKQDEFEADRIGASLLALAGYDPTALQRYLLRIDAAKGSTTADIHRTHPPNSERSGALVNFYRENGIESDSGAINKERFKHYVQL
jgi:predicted Zn-dependent protease